MKATVTMRMEFNMDGEVSKEEVLEHLHLALVEMVGIDTPVEHVFDSISVVLEGAKPRVAAYEGKLVIIAYGPDVSFEETHEVINDFVGRDWDWEQVWDWHYGDGDPGFGINPSVDKDDPRVITARDEIAKMMVGEEEWLPEEITERVTKLFATEDVIVLFVEEG